MSCSTNKSAKATDPVCPRLQELIDLYRQASGISLPVSGHISRCDDKALKATCLWTFTDVDANEKLSLETVHVLRTDPYASEEPNFFCAQPSREMSSSIYVSLYSSGPRNLQAICKSVKRGDKNIDLVEIWQSNRRLATYRSEKEDLHGKIITKGDFSRFEWSQNETKLLFIAEKKQPAAKSFFSYNIEKNDEPGTEFRWNGNWGEQTYGCSCPVVVVLELTFKENGNYCTVKPTLIEMERHSLCQAIFTPNALGVVVVALSNEPYRLGTRFCDNRTQSLHYFDFARKKFTEIGEPNKCIYSPRVFQTPDQSIDHETWSLLYLQNDVGGPHQMASQLIRVNLSHDSNSGSIVESNRQVLVSVPQDPKEDEFPGLYLARLIRRCISSNGQKVYLSAGWHSRRVILQVDTETGIVANLTKDEVYGEYQLFDVYEDYLLACRSSPSIESHVVFGILHVDADEVQVRWTPIDKSTSTELGQLKWEITKFRPPEAPQNFFEAIHVQPKKKRHSLIVYPHGGPHSHSIASFMPHVLFLLEAGYNVLMINYRGSVGFGDKNLRALPANIGFFDVRDVQQAVEHVQAKNPCKQIYLFGGSHGGFLAAHLAGQYPSTYRACCLINPVIDLSMLGPSDIPDWFWFEGGCNGDFRHDFRAKDTDLASLRARSPMAHAHKIVAPCHFFLGKNDLRIDKSQGLRLHQYLLAKGVQTRCNLYEDDHSLMGKTAHIADVFINAVLWFEQFEH